MTTTKIDKGVLVMLEKALGKINMSKLRSMLLLKVDFNTLHKIIFNIKLILKLEQSKQIL
jgi:hypothetical protein